MKDDEVFTAALNESRKTASAVCRWLNSFGHRVRELPQKDRTCKEDRWDYVDDGDLVIEQRIEVKQRPDLDFQGPSDLPYKDIIVDEAYKVDKVHKYSLHSYIIVNASKTVSMVIDKSTKPHWFKKEVFDSKENEYRTFYFIPKNKVRFVKMSVDT